jgi:hypothetical protein
VAGLGRFAHVLQETEQGGLKFFGRLDESLREAMVQ